MLKINNTIKLRTYDILSEKIQEGINFGWTHAHKHVDNPDEDTIKERIYEDVMNSLSEVIDYGN